MTNYEKYKELVIRCVLKDSVCELAHEVYEDKSCDTRTCDECCEFVAEWLKREYSGIDWSKVPVDTPVIIKDEKGTMFRHFSGYLHGPVFVYANGQTSWTNDGETEAWEPEFVKLGRDEDNKKICKTINAAKNATKGNLAAMQSVPDMPNLKKDWKKIKSERRKEYNKFNRYIYGIDKNQNK